MHIFKIDLLCISILFLTIFLANIAISNIEIISPDASGYLDMGRNLFSGKGAVTSYNLYQFWTGKYYPFLPYRQPIYPIIAGLIWTLFNFKGVLCFNILLLSVNCIFLYKILRLKADYLISFLIALFMGFSKNLIFTAIFPWTEQLHLFFLLLAIYIYLRYEKPYFLIGIILGVTCLVRVAGFYNIFAFGITLIVLKGFSKEAFKEYIKIASGFLLIFLSYEAFCYLRYRTLYPEYLAAASTYNIAWFYPGAFYKNTLPVLNVPPLEISKDVIFTNIRNHLSEFVKIFANMKFALILTPIYIIFNVFKKRRNALLIIFFFQGVCIILSYPLSVAQDQLIDSLRFSLIPFITLGSIGFLSLKEILDSFFPKKNKKWFSAIFTIIILIFLCFQIKNYVPYRNYWINTYPEKYKDYWRDRDDIYEWIKTNTEEDTLIASEFLEDPFFFERPFVSLPIGHALTSKNMADFLNIYKPEYLLTQNVKLIEFLKNTGFIERKRNGLMVLLERKTNVRRLKDYKKLEELKGERPRDLDQMLKELLEEIEQGNASATVYNNLGNVYAEKGMVKEALGAYQNAIKADPEYPMVYKNLSIFYRNELKNKELADDYMEKYRTLKKK